MKKLLDKPYKSVLALTLILILNVMTDYYLIASLLNTARSRTGIRSIEKINTDVVENVKEDESMDTYVEKTDKEELIEQQLASIDLTKESSTNEVRVTSQMPLSRGGAPIKKLTQRELINTYVRDIALKYNMEPELIMSIIQQESNYNPNLKTGDCLGLMQVSLRWHKDRANKLGVTDFYDPYGNILLGVDYLHELHSKHEDIRFVLMLYNMVHDTAIRMYKNGQISNYAKTVLARAEEYKKGE